MEEYKEYTVIWGSGRTLNDANDDLSQQIYQYLSDGWKFQGGVCLTVDLDGDYILSQALVR